MTKRKIKFNILDVAIVLIALASCFLVFFSDAVSELFGDPEIEIVEMTVKINDADAVLQISQSVGRSVMFVTEKQGEYSEFQVLEVISDLSQKPDSATVVLACRGYEKFGRFYTENGERILPNVKTSYINKGITVECEVISIKIKE